MIHFQIGIGLSYDERIAKTLRFMQSSRHEFFLGGSRYCGDATKESDWDFYVQGDKNWTNSLGYELYKEGFKMILWEEESSPYTSVYNPDYSPDDGTYAIYELNCRDGKIQIAIVKNIMLKHFMYTTAVKERWSKSKRKNIDNWNNLYKRLLQGCNNGE